MEINRFNIQACCGKTSIIFKTSVPITSEHLLIFVNLGFKEATHFTKAGILYVDNSDIIITTPFGSNKLQVKCRKSNCEEIISNFEALIKKIN